MNNLINNLKSNILPSINDKEKYSMFLVHTITLREDGLPIEGNGVEPHISFDDKNWKQQLMERYNTQSLVDAVSEVQKK